MTFCLNDHSVHALIVEGGDGFEAQMLELDIAVRGATHGDIIREFEHAITILYEAAMMLGLEPFAGIQAAPTAIQERWIDNGLTCYIRLPRLVADKFKRAAASRSIQLA